MLTHLTVRNYQSIADADLPLGSITVVTGPSSSGKSALLRALFSLIENTRGSAFVRHGTSTASVVLTDDSTDEVAYTKSAKGSATYRFRDMVGQADQDYSAVGSAVPEDITTWLNLLPASVGRQFDPPFLLTDSPAEVATHFSALTQSRVLQDAVSHLHKQRSTQTADSKAARKLADDYDARLAKVADLVPLLDHHHTRLTTDTPALREAHKRTTALTDAYRTLRSFIPELGRSKAYAAELAPVLDEARQAQHTMLDQAARRTTLRAASSALANELDLLDVFTVYRVDLAPVLTEARARRIDVEKVQDNLLTLRDALQRLVTHAADLAAARKRLTEVSAHLSRTRSTLALVQSELGRRTPPPTECPVCLQALTGEDAIARVQEHMTTHPTAA